MHNPDIWNFSSTGTTICIFGTFQNEHHRDGSFRLSIHVHALIVQSIIALHVGTYFWGRIFYPNIFCNLLWQCQRKRDWRYSNVSFRKVLNWRRKNKISKTLCQNLRSHEVLADNLIAVSQPSPEYAIFSSDFFMSFFCPQPRKGFLGGLFLLERFLGRSLHLGSVLFLPRLRLLFFNRTQLNNYTSLLQKNIKYIWSSIDAKYSKLVKSSLKDETWVLNLPLLPYSENINSGSNHSLIFILSKGDFHKGALRLIVFQPILERQGLVLVLTLRLRLPFLRKPPQKDSTGEGLDSFFFGSTFSFASLPEISSQTFGWECSLGMLSSYRNLVPTLLLLAWK